MQANIARAFDKEFYAYWNKKDSIAAVSVQFAVAVWLLFAFGSCWFRSTSADGVSTLLLGGLTMRLLWTSAFLFATYAGRSFNFQKSDSLQGWLLHQGVRLEILHATLLAVVMEDLREHDISGTCAALIMSLIFFVPSLPEKLFWAFLYAVGVASRSLSWSQTVLVPEILGMLGANVTDSNQDWSPQETDINSRNSVILVVILSLPCMVWIHNYTIIQFMQNLPSQRIVMDSVFLNTSEVGSRRSGSTATPGVSGLQAKDNYFKPSELTQIADEIQVERQEMDQNQKVRQGWEVKSFEIQFSIGQGGYGKVYAIKSEGSRYALKLAADANNPSDQRALDAEIAMLEWLSHPNILRYIGRTDKGFVMELCEQGTIKDLLRQVAFLEQSDAGRLTRDILQGLSYLHRHDVVHRDIKTTNLLLREGVVVIGDFGVALSVLDPQKESRKVKGTLVYMPPEALSDGFCGRQMDIWAVGCVLLEMMAGDFGGSQIEPNFLTLVLMSKMCSAPKIPQDFSSDVKYFLEKCLHSDPFKRFSAPQLLGLPFISESPAVGEPWSEKVEKGLSKLKGTRTSTADPLVRDLGSDTLSPEDTAMTLKNHSILQQFIKLIEGMDKKFANPVTEELFNKTFRAERLFIARSTGQFMNPMSYLIHVFSWLHTPPTTFGFALSTAINFGAAPINYFPVYDVDFFVDKVYGRITRLARPALGLMPEKHPLFAVMYLFNMATACVGSSFSLKESACSLGLVAVVQSLMSIGMFVYKYEHLEEDMKGSVSKLVEETETRILTSISSAGFCFYMLYLLRQSERKRFARRMAQMKHVDPKELMQRGPLTL